MTEFARTSPMAKTPRRLVIIAPSVQTKPFASNAIPDFAIHTVLGASAYQKKEMADRDHGAFPRPMRRLRQVMVSSAPFSPASAETSVSVTTSILGWAAMRSQR